MKWLSILMVLALAACTTPCSQPTSVAGLITGSLSSIGKCNEAGARLLSNDINSVIGGLGLCSNNKAGVLASVVCAPAIAALGTISTSALNDKYKGCDFSSAMQGPQTILIELCSQLPF